MIDLTKIEEKICPEVVHVLTEPTIEHGEEFLPGWYFWNETWSDRYGPYSTQEEAQNALDYYCETEL